MSDMTHGYFKGPGLRRLLSDVTANNIDTFSNSPRKDSHD